MSAISGLDGIWTLFCAVGIAGVAYTAHVVRANSEGQTEVFLVPSTTDKNKTFSSEESYRASEPGFDFYEKGSEEYTNISKALGLPMPQKWSTEGHNFKIVKRNPTISTLFLAEQAKATWFNRTADQAIRVIRLGDVLYSLVEEGDELRLVPLSSQVSL